MTTQQVRATLVWIVRIAFYGLFAALLLRQCQGDDPAAAATTTAVDPVALQAQCFDNVPPLFYDQAGTCYSEDPTGLTAEERALVAVVPAVRGGPVVPGVQGAPSGPLPPGLVDPRSPAANPPPALVPPGGATTGTDGTTGTSTDGTTGPAGDTTNGAGGAAPADGTTGGAGGAPADGVAGGQGAQPGTPADTGPVGGAAQTPTSPALGYIAEDGRTDSVREGPVVNGIQVWVHEPSRTLYADSCEVLQTISGLDQEFGPTPEAPGYGSICPQL